MFRLLTGAPPLYHVRPRLILPALLPLLQSDTTSTSPRASLSTRSVTRTMRLPESQASRLANLFIRAICITMSGVENWRIAW